MSGGTSAALQRLAARMGVLPEYVDQTGRDVRRTSDDTNRALLAAMGLDASSEHAAADALAALEAEAMAEIVAPVVVARAGTRDATTVAPRLSHPTGAWRAELTLEDGETIVVDGTAGSHATLPELPLGYHRLRVTTSAHGGERQVEQLRIVTPSRCFSPDEVLHGRNAFGLTANLYTVRSGTNWGVGDFTDLANLAGWAATRGAEFVGVNPLHALLNRGTDISPYSPVTRLFRNPLYIDVSRVPELDRAPELCATLASPEIGARLEALRESRAVQYEQVMAVKGLALDALHRVFEREQAAGAGRAADYDAFVGDAGPALARFATWMAIAERFGGNWREWPRELQAPDAPAVRAFARDARERVAFHQWLQFEADSQLARAAGMARDAGMRVGLYQDLAIGSSPCGADTWAEPHLFAHGVAVGAPPDPYSYTGQNWGFPPIDPRRLRSRGYRYFIDLLRGAFRHAGALRIDHVLGFFRMFWIPDGASGEDGAYVRYPVDDLFGILALESVRHRALVVGEDLGTVPPEVPATLDAWGVLSSKVMFFEREWNGAFRPASSYPALALATADTHDMSPIAGFWSGVDIDVREEVGLLTPAAASEERRKREGDRAALRERLAAEHVLPIEAAPTGAELRGAVHAMMCRTPSKLVGLALDDIAGESTPVNVPGVGLDRFASWTRKMTGSLETIAASPETEVAMRCDGRRGVGDG